MKVNEIAFVSLLVGQLGVIILALPPQRHEAGSLQLFALNLTIPPYNR